MKEMSNNDDIMSGCSPEKCSGCSGCGGDVIEKISIKVEWQHKGTTTESATEIDDMMYQLSGELMVSGVELTYINNNFGKDIKDNSSTFFVNGHPLKNLVDLSPNEPVSQELLRKGIFQALLRNL